MKKKIFAILISCCFLISVNAQQLQEGQKRWSTDAPLAVDDFKIQISDENADPVYSQFVISHAINGFDFLKKNLNQRIENVFYGNASWIDTTRVDELQKQIEFQQLQFDLAEVYTRKFRKRVLENKGKIVKGFNIVNQISDDIMREFSNSRLQLVQETRGGNNEQKLAEWKVQVAANLKQLEEFSYENKKAVKFSN